MDLIIRNPIPVINDTLVRIIDNNPIVRNIIKYTKRLLSNPVNFMLLGCYAVCMGTPVIVYISLTFLAFASAMMIAISFLGCFFGGISITIVASSMLLFGGFLVVAAHISVIVYILQKLGIVAFSPCT